MAMVTGRAARTTLVGVLTAAVVAGGIWAAAPAGATVARAAATNLVANPSAETLTRGVPKGWTKGWTGTNRPTLSVVARGGGSGPRFVRTRITSWTSGGAWWTAPPAAVTGGATYRVQDLYRSGTDTRMLAAATVGGKLVWLTLGDVPAAKTWTAAGFTVTVPAGTTALRVAHSLRAAGYLDVDGVSVTPAPGAAAAPAATPTPTPTAAPVAVKGATATGKGLISLTFDDGTADHYTNVLPALRAKGQVGTFYIISGYLNAKTYLTIDQIKALQGAGNEIGSHTVNHPHLSDLSAAEVESQFSESKKTLEANFGPVTDVAYPYGGSNETVRQIAAKYYASGRSTDGGPNVRGAYDHYRLTIGYVLNTTSLDTVKQWIADAQAKNTWLILCYHGVNEGKPDETYNVSPATFAAQLAAVKTAGIPVVTVRDGLRLTAG